MHIRSTTDPNTPRDVPDPDHHPCVYEGDGDNGLEIYFENEERRRIYLDIELEDKKILMGDNVDDYVAQG